jgi:hypothetical protein
MNSLAVAGGLSILGLLGFVMYEVATSHVQEVSTVQVAKMDCHNARFDAEFDSMRGASKADTERAASEADAACSEYQSKRVTADIHQAAADNSNDKLRHDIGDAWNK